MLILTRRIQEAIMIGDDVTLTILSVRGNQVRIGIDAPKNVEVHREEIYHIARAKKLSSKAPKWAQPDDDAEQPGDNVGNN